ncbi:uncharacterized protein LOC135687497 isoform X1 [Rhopilema esculentum]|uniref:uncharacterized protein LOC135687497 isoform X1 n=1 Tax=Rhopilema esculentum TaxID=499914 RepID=UPI0031DD7C3A
MSWPLSFSLVMLVIHRLHSEKIEISCIREVRLQGFIDPQSGTQLPCYNEDGDSNCKIVLFGSERLQCLKKCCPKKSSSTKKPMSGALYIVKYANISSNGRKSLKINSRLVSPAWRDVAIFFMCVILLILIGKLSHWLQKAVGNVDNVEYYLIDRQNHRHKGHSSIYHSNGPLCNS